jgi:hypothetical protein
MSFEYFDHPNVEFGVCRGKLRDGRFAIVPIDDGVKNLLEEMVSATREALGMNERSTEFEAYEVSEQYGAEARLALTLNDELLADYRALYGHGGIQTIPDALDNPGDIGAYFCVIYDQNGEKLVAIRRAAQLKATVKKRFIRILDETLHAVDGTVFQLDTDFDILLVDGHAYIRHPASFEQLADVEEQVVARAAENIERLETAMPKIGFRSVAPYVCKHKRAARIIASLRRRGDLANITVESLRRECRKNGVSISTIDGQLCPDKGAELAFLNILDRRRYVVSLIPRKHEQYEAGSRKWVGIREPPRVEGRELI